MTAVNDFLVIFASIVFEAMPFIILGALISGTLEELLPQQWISRIIPRRRALAIGGSALLGLVFPMCECGIVPVMRRLLGKGLPLSCAVAYMLAAPIINPVVIASTWAAFSGDRKDLDGLNSAQMVALRVSLAFCTALVVGLIVEWRARRLGAPALVRSAPAANHDNEHSHAHGTCDHPHHHHEHEDAHAHEASHEHQPVLALKTLPAVEVHDAFAAPELQRKTVLQRLGSISETALHDFIDIACFLVIGAFLASVVQTLNVVQSAPALGENPLLAIPAMMGLAILLCLCSEADAFVAANLIKIPLGGKIAFLVLGPMLDLKLFFMYTRVFRQRLIWTIIPSVVACVLILSVAVEYWYDKVVVGIISMVFVIFLMGIMVAISRLAGPKEAS